MKKILNFILITITSSVTVFVFFIMFFRMDLIIELLSSKPVLLLMGLAIGSTVGFLVGTLATYSKLKAELDSKKSEVKKLREDLREAKSYLKKVLPDVIAVRNLQAATAAEEAKHDADKRSRQIFGEIDELSDTSVSNLETVDEGPYADL